MAAIPPSTVAKREHRNNGPERRAAYADVDVLKAEHAREVIPAAFNEKTFERVLMLVAKGGQITQICNGVPPYPSYISWYRWLDKSEELRKRYARARHMLVERMADEVIMIADGKLPLDIDEPTNPQRDRLRVEARRWVMGKLNPAFWGDKDKPALPPPEEESQRTIIDVRSLDPATRKALKAALVAIEEAER